MLSFFKPRYKANIVVYGNCQAGILADLFHKTPSLRERFHIIHHFVHYSEDEVERRATEMANARTVFIQDVSDWERDPVRFAVPAYVQRVDFPFLHAAALWPFDGTLNPPDTVAKEGGGPYRYEDSLLGALRTHIPDPEERFSSYRELSWLPESMSRYRNLNEHVEICSERLLRIDQRFGLSVGRYFLDNVSDRRLFHTITHPTGDFLLRLAEELISKTDLKFQPSNVPDSLNEYQVPIHPLVAETCQLNWVRPETEYNFGGKQRRTFAAYTRGYIEAYG